MRNAHLEMCQHVQDPRPAGYGGETSKQSKYSLAGEQISKMHDKMKYYAAAERNESLDTQF